jgi:hypothetical protein
VDEVALGQDFLGVLQFFPLSIIPAVLHIHLYLELALTSTHRRNFGTFEEAEFFKTWSSIT